MRFYFNIKRYYALREKFQQALNLFGTSVARFRCSNGIEDNLK
jgi:hypothetical protein